MEITEREERIKDAVLRALETGKRAALEAAAQQLGEDAKTAKRVVHTIWTAIEEGELVDYIWDILESMRMRGEY